MTIALKLAEHVQEGMKALDEFYERKDWVFDMDLRNLELMSTTECVIGQQFDGRYDEGCDSIRHELPGFEPEEGGFDLPYWNSEDWEEKTKLRQIMGTDHVLIGDPTWEILTGLWIHAINARIRELYDNAGAPAEEEFLVEERMAEVRAELQGRLVPA